MRFGFGLERVGQFGRQSEPMQDFFERAGKFADGDRESAEVIFEVMEHRVSGVLDEMRIEFA
jgi:hypothetical protein